MMGWCPRVFDRTFGRPFSESKFADAKSCFGFMEP